MAKYPHLIECMDKNKITKRELANLSHTHRNTISNKLNGHTPLFLDEAIHIHEVFFSEEDFLELFKERAR